MRSAQRNTYLTGFCLFLSLVLTRTFYIILDLIHTQEEYAKLKNSVRPFIPIPLRLRTHSEAPQTGKSAGADQTKQIEELKKKANADPGVVEKTASSSSDAASQTDAAAAAERDAHAKHLASVKKTHFKDFFVYFSEWRHLKVLLGTCSCWFLLDIA